MAENDKEASLKGEKCIMKIGTDEKGRPIITPYCPPDEKGKPSPCEGLKALKRVLESPEVVVNPTKVIEE